MAEETTKLAIFEQREIRRLLLDGEWWFSVVDTIAVLTASETLETTGTV